VLVGEAGGQLAVEVQDDGAGFDPELRGQGFGITGMQERVRLAGGRLSIEARNPGILVSARLPIQRHGGGGERSPAGAPQEAVG
jgi:signal transduction histidine kinase